MEALQPDPAAAIIAEAEAVLRGAADDVERPLDACELPLRLAAEQLARAAHRAQDALSALYSAAQAYGALQAEAYRQAESVGLSAPHRPDGTSPFDTAAEADGLLILRGTAYARHSPTEVLLRTLTYVLSENGPALPAGSRIEVRVRGLDEGAAS